MSISHANPDQLHPPEGDNPDHIMQVGPGRRSEAIERLVSTTGGNDRAAAERFLHYAGTNSVPLDGLWACQGPDGRLQFSVLAVPSPGRTAMFFASHPRTGPEVSPVSRLIEHACEFVDEQDVQLAQALLEPGEQLERQAFIGAGFTELAILSYLERPLSRTNPSSPPQWPSDTRVAAYRQDLREELIGVLDASYEHTLDCPGLYGLRKTDDILAGHQATGEFDPALWTLMYIGDRPAGAMLLNAFPAHRTVELVYLGLAPFARGRGLGRQLLRHGLAQLKRRRERTLTLAVDDRNTPALALYESEGLRPIVKRVALIRSLRTSAGNS